MNKEFEPVDKYRFCVNRLAEFRVLKPDFGSNVTHLIVINGALFFIRSAERRFRSDWFELPLEVLR